MGDPVQTAKAAAQAAAARVASGQLGVNAASAVVTVLQATLDAFAEMAARGARYNHEVVRQYQATWNNLRGTIIFGAASYSRLPKLTPDGIWGTGSATVASGLLIINGSRATSVPVATTAFADWYRINQSDLTTMLVKARRRVTDATTQLGQWTQQAAALEAAWHTLEAAAAQAVDAGSAQGRTIVQQGSPQVPGSTAGTSVTTLPRPGQPGGGVLTLPGDTVTAARPSRPVWPWVVAGVVAVGFAGFLLWGRKRGKK